MNNTNKIIGELGEFIAYPTISSERTNESAMFACARWLQHHFYSIGMKVATIYHTSAHPVVYSEFITDPSIKTVLFYGHYDVQPVDPIQQWHTSPFKIAVVGDHMFGRGVSDDKGQIFIHIKAVASLLAGKASLPVNIKFLIEGSEETGSLGLRDFIAANRTLLACDVAVVSDTKMAAANIPAITYSLRGELNLEIFIQSSANDLHSGTFGGAVPNAAIILSDFISSLHDKNGMVNIPAFYNDVEKISGAEKSFGRANGFSDKSLLHDAAVKKDWGNQKFTMHERTTILPSISVTGITSGFQGIGIKKIIPSKASVKLNCRLVPNQQPEKIKKILNDFIKKEIPAHVKLVIEYGACSNPVYVPKSNKYISAAIDAYRKVFEKNVMLTRSGGTIAAVDHLFTILRIPIVLMGFAQVSDNMHAPNEKMYLPNFFKGIRTSILFMKNVSLLNHQPITHAASYY